MADSTPTAYSAIPTASPAATDHGLQVSDRGAGSCNQIRDLSHLPKVLVAGAPPSGGPLAVDRGTLGRSGQGTIIACVAPGEVLVLGRGDNEDGPPGRWVREHADEDAPAIDVTHGHSLFELEGPQILETLEKVCPIPLADRHANVALRTSIAGVASEVLLLGVEPARLLLQCGRSYGRYMWSVLVDAGAEFGLRVAAPNA